MDKINLRPFSQEIDDLGVGETGRYNHRDCPAGEDVRRRLYITRPRAKPDSAVAFCHNCQSSGFWKDGNTYRRYRDKLHADNTLIAPPVTDKVSVPEGLIEHLHLWPTLAQAWVFEAKLTQSELNKYKIAYDPSTNRVYLPRYNYYPFGALCGYQLRKIDPADNGPKYITARTKEDKGFTIISSTTSNTPSNTVIVEDLVSGIHVARARLDVNVLVNYGVRVNVEALNQIKASPKLLVWLDNDNDTVRDAAKAMQRTWQLLAGGRVAYVESTYNDPKHQTATTIKSVVKDYFYG